MWREHQHQAILQHFQFWQHLPTDSITPCELRAQFFKKAPLPFRSQIINPGCHCVSELPTKLLKGLINLLDLLTEFWEIFHLLDYQLVKKKKKGIIQEQSCDTLGKSWGKGHSISTFWGLHAFSTSTCSPNPIFSDFYGSFTIWKLTESWHWWFNLQPPSSPGQRGVGLKVPTLL